MPNLTKEQNSRFLELARKMGHDPKVLADKGEHSTTVTLKSVEEARSFFQHHDEKVRKQLVATAKTDVKDAQMQAEAFIFGDGELTREHQEAIKEHFPIQVRAISLVDKTLAPGEVWDLGTSDSPVVVNLGTLTMEPKSRIEIRNTVLKFDCQTLIRNS